MIRVLVFLVLLAFVALGAAWLADHPGEVVLTWQDYRISTPLSVAVAALIGIVTALVIVWSVVRFVFKLRTIRAVDAALTMPLCNGRPERIC